MDPNDFITKEKIGFGSFAEVIKAVRKKTQEKVAIKILHLDKIKDEIENIQKEISLLSRLDSQYVTKYIGSYLKGSDLHVVMEYMGGGSLRDIMKPAPLEESIIAIIMREVLNGLMFLHSNNIVHRDIKAANILLSKDGKVKIADFGVAKEISEKSAKRFSVVGSPYWMAPEVIDNGKGGHNEKADIWSLGITAIELAKGNPPRSDKPPMKVLVDIPKNEPPKLEGKFSKAFKDFVSICLKKKPEERPSAKELLNHPFLKGAKDTSHLVEVITKYKNWIKTNNNIEDHRYSEPIHVKQSLSGDNSDSIEDWDLSSIDKTSEHGSSTGSVRLRSKSSGVSLTDGLNDKNEVVEEENFGSVIIHDLEEINKDEDQESNMGSVIIKENTSKKKSEKKLSERKRDDRLKSKSSSDIKNIPITPRSSERKDSESKSSMTPNKYGDKSNKQEDYKRNKSVDRGSTKKLSRDGTSKARKKKAKDNIEIDSSRAILNHVILPILTEEQSKNDKIKENMGKLISDFSVLESQQPGITKEIFVQWTNKYDKEINLSKQVEPLADLTKYLMERWKDKKNPQTLDPNNYENYFI